jgi:hypothetical protein
MQICHRTKVLKSSMKLKKPDRIESYSATYND